MKIVINRSDAIGDTILTSPMAQLIKDHIPEAEVIFIISPKCQGLFENHPYVDQYWVLNPKRSRVRNFWDMFRKFRGDRPKAYFHVGGSSIPALVAWLLFIRVRGGIKSKIASFLFLNKSTRQKRSMVEMHESDYNLSLLWPLGIKYNYKDRARLKPVITISSQEAEQANTLFNSELNESQRAREAIFVHPGMVGHTLNWSSRNYARLTQRLDGRYPGRFLFVISHTPADSKYIDNFRDELTQIDDKVDAIFYFDGSKRGLRDYMANLSGAKLFIGPSTGTTHIANALGVPQVVIFSPVRVQSALRWGPFNRGKNVSRVITPEVVCGEATRCAKESCPYYKCMAKIEVDDVIEQAVALIDGNGNG